MSNLLDSASIVLTPTAYDNGRMLSVKPNTDLLGAELVTNGDFATDSDWSLTQATISNGAATFVTTDGSFAGIRQNVFTIGKTYLISLEVSNLIGTAQVNTNGSTSIGLDITSNGVKSFYMVAENTDIEIKRKFGITNVSATIDNVSIKEDLSGDFDFSRNSAATRVNAQGLVENVQILSGDLVSNGDFSQEGVQEVSNGSFSQEGAELITNGDFATDSDWNKGAGWSISGGKLRAGDVDNINAFQAQVFTNGKTYKVTYTISDYTKGSVRFQFGGGGDTVNGQINSSNGVYTEYILATVNHTSARFRGQSTDEGFTGSIDNVSVKEVGQDWDLGTGWSIGEDKAICDGTNQAVISQNQNLVVGNTYKFTFEISDYVSGILQAYLPFGVANLGSFSADGIYTLYVSVTSTPQNNIYFRGLNGNSFNGSITNISVKEVGQDWTLGTGWSIGEDKAVHSGTVAGNLTQNVFTSGKSYKVKWTQTNGEFVNVWGDGLSSLISSSDVNKDYTFYFNSVSGGNISFRTDRDGAEVTNISVIEITDDTNLPRINYEGFSYQDSLGSEEVVNGDYEESGIGNATSQSGGILVNENNQLKITSNGSSGYSRAVWNTGGAGTFLIEADIISISGSTRFINVTDNVGQSLVQGTTFSTIITFGSGSGSVGFGGLADTSFELILDNVSVKEYLGQEVVPDSGCGSWLLEPQSTNLVAQSEYYNAYWGLTLVSITDNATNSPEGLQNASKLIPDNGTGGNRSIAKTFESLTGLHTFSVFAKAGEYGYISLRLRNAPSAFAMFDLTNGLVHATNTNAQMVSGSPKIEDYGNGWYRCSIVLDPSGSTETGKLLVSYSVGVTGNETNNFSGDGVSGIYIWGAMFEQQSYATSYIPTNGAASTRLQDIATNSGNATLINSTEGVLYVNLSDIKSQNFDSIIINNGIADENNQVRIWFYNNTLTYQYKVGSVTSAQIALGTIDLTSDTKIACSWKLNEFKLFVNGSKIGQDLSGNVLANGTLESVDFKRGNNTGNFYGKTKALVVYKEALTDEQLTCLTTI